MAGGSAERAEPERSEGRRSVSACVHAHACTHARTHCTYALHTLAKKFIIIIIYYVVCAVVCAVGCAVGCAVDMLQMSMCRGLRCAVGCAVSCAVGCAVGRYSAGLETSDGDGYGRQADGNVKRAGRSDGDGYGWDGRRKRVGWGAGNGSAGGLETARAGRRLATAASAGRKDTCSDKSPLTT